MCELFGYSGRAPMRMNSYLKEFTSHSCDHPDGWGIAVFHGNAVNLEKEPITANNSYYLRERLKHTLTAKSMMAHIRLSTKGGLAYENTHPFVQRDDSDRVWTLIHNGTIFDSPILDRYIPVQEGRSDSERILCHIIEQMNSLIRSLDHAPTAEERFRVMDRIIHEITPLNKVNLIIYDGEIFYVHTNMRGTLNMKYLPEGVLIATVPLDSEGWEPVPFMQFLAFRDGEQILTGTPHNNEYFLNQQDRVIQPFEYAFL